MDCSAIPNVNYSEFSEVIFDKSGAKRLPIGISIEITGKCNVSCLHCYMPDMSGRNELRTGEIQRILDELAEAGTLWLTITGGEPLCRRDFEEIYTYAKKKGFLITLFSNGTLVNEDIADMLSDWPPFAIEITVHSMNEEIFEQISRVKGSYKRCMNGIKLLSDRGLNLRLKTVVMRQNKDEIDNVRRFAEGIGAEHRFDPHIQPKIDGGKEPLNIRLSAKEVVELDLRHGRITKDWKLLFDKFGGNTIPVQDRVYTCWAGINGAYINAEGRISACVSTQHEYYDLRNGSLKEAWSEFLPKVINKKPKAEYKCGSCQLKILCGCCAGISYLETGDEGAVVDFLCELGFLRKRALDEHVLIEGKK